MWADESNVSIYNNTIANLTSSIEGTGGYNLLHGIVYGDVEAKGPVNIYDNTIQKIHIKSLTGTAILNGLTVEKGNGLIGCLCNATGYPGSRTKK